MLKSMVREALLASVTCTLPPVSFQSSQESTVPKASSPDSRQLAGAGHVLEDPRNLGCGEIGVDQQAGALLDERLVALASAVARRSQRCGGLARRWRCRQGLPV